MVKYQNPNFDKEAYQRRRANGLRGQIPTTFEDIVKDQRINLRTKIDKIK